jgi:CRP-like cAMP-binding protein
LTTYNLFQTGGNKVTGLAAAVRSVLISAPEVGPLLHLRRDAILSHQKQEAEAVFLIEAGLIKLTRKSKDDSRQIISVVGSHQLVGDECLSSDPSAYWAEAECLTDAAVFRIPLPAVKRLFGIPELAVALVSYAIASNIRFIHKIELLAHHDVEHRILYGLAELARLVRPQLDGSAFPIPITQADLASFVGATRETTSTTLSHLQSRKLVALARRLVTTVHPDLLVAAANQRSPRTKSAHGS